MTTIRKSNRKGDDVLLANGIRVDMIAIQDSEKILFNVALGVFR
jgi:hypothetical protein